MANYLHRLNAVEKIIAPRRAGPHLVWLSAGQTEDEAIAAYAEAHGLTIPDVEANMICFSWTDARL